ncbi:MAG TPA: hypothetical protein VEH06_04695 [Candidatus Bathyarchaeia archaeon]|nr:hypothetical protein [Candidatus Bathyarchaeia archaeon]
MGWVSLIAWEVGWPVFSNSSHGKQTNPTEEAKSLGLGKRTLAVF